MTNAERQRRYQAKRRDARLRRARARIDAVAKPVIAAVLAGGDLDAVPPGARQGCLASAEAVIKGLRDVGLSIVRTSSLG
jgi:hypothetical protein